MSDSAKAMGGGDGLLGALYAAAREGRVNDVKMLLAKGANRDEINPETGLTARQAAGLGDTEGCKEVVQLLSDCPGDGDGLFVECEVVAYHEAGHAVAYYELGYVGLHCVSVLRKPTPMAVPDDSGARAKMGGIALYSGPAAHAKWLHKPLDDAFVELVAKGDMQFIDRHAHEEARRTGGAVVDIKQKWRQDAVNLIERCWPKVCRLAHGLLKVPKIYGRAAVALMNDDIHPEADEIERIHNDGQAGKWSRRRR